MQIAEGWLILDEHQSNTRLTGLTPAEVYYLNETRKKHKDDKEPKVIHLKLLGDSKRTNSQEKERLLMKYPKEENQKNLVDSMFPGPSPMLAQTFAEYGLEVTNTAPKSGKLLPYPSKGEHMVDKFKELSVYDPVEETKTEAVQKEEPLLVEM